MVDTRKFLETYRKEYNFLYNADGYVAGYDEAVDAFDKFLKEKPEFVSEIAKARGDIFSSDREAAAFMFAMESEGLL